MFFVLFIIMIGSKREWDVSPFFVCLRIVFWGRESSFLFLFCLSCFYYRSFVMMEVVKYIFWIKRRGVVGEEAFFLFLFSIPL